MNTYKEIERLREEEYNMKFQTTIDGKTYEQEVDGGDFFPRQDTMILEMTEVPAKPAYDRMACLRGEYIPPVGSEYFVAWPDGSIRGSFTCRLGFDFERGIKD